MRVLHYTLGLPPYRTGGLTKYAYDLMIEQINNKYDVYLLFPGEIKKNKNLEIRYHKNVQGIKSYEIINPLPVPLLKGVCEPELYMTKVDYIIYKEFLNQINVDIINIHTLMGLHEEFIRAAKELNIKLVYTTHDYYGLCTKVNFLNSEGDVCKLRDVDRCIKCNQKGYGLNIIKILQSKQYRRLKNIGAIDTLKLIISKIKKIFKYTNISKNSTNKEKVNVYEDSYNKRESYNNLLNYYENMFNRIDRFIFNSNVAKEVYSQYLNTKGIITNITHNEIKDNRVKRSYNDKTLKLLYLGPSKPYKGFNLLCEIMKELESYKDITLHMYGNLEDKVKVSDNIVVKGKYKYKQLKEIFNSVDILIVPSIWKETFGFITLEAISYGVPVIVTENVGSKDIVDLEIKNGIVVESDKKAIKETILEIYKDKNILRQLNDNILINQFNYSLKSHFEHIDEIYTNIINNIE